MPHQAQYDAARKMISLAAMKTFSPSNAFHEAFHAVFQHYLDTDQRKQLYKAFRSPMVKAQIKALLHESPEAWERAKSNPEELMSYGFQFWHADALKIASDPHTTIGRIFKYLSDKWDQVNNWLRDQPSAEQMLQQIKDGAFADGKPSPVETALSKRAEVLKRVKDVTKTVFKMVDKLYENLLTPYDTRIRDLGNPHLDKLARRMYAQVGEHGSGRGMVQEIPVQAKARLNALDKLMRDPSGTFGKTLEEMASGGDEAATDKAMAGKIRGWLDAQHKYGTDAGVTMGKVQNYIPMSWSGEKIAAKRADFVAMLERHADDLASIDPKLTPEKVADMMAKRGTATGEFLGSAFDEHGAPQADHTLDRVFSFLDNADRRPFVRDDLPSGMMRYAKQMVKRAEWTRRFGEKGELWNAQIEKAREYGLSKDEEGLLKDYKDDAFGAKLHDMNPTVRKALQINTVYQNYRVLGLSVLSNLIDPFGVAVRSGQWSDAFDAYKMAASRMFKGGKAKTADLEELGHMIGAIERSGVADTIAGTYGGVNIEGTLRKANDALFNYNGMNGLTRSVRLAALAAGVNFVGRHGRDGAPAESERHLSELGLTKDDVKLDQHGRLAILPEDFAQHGLEGDAAAKASDKVQSALNRFVDESAMHPNIGERTRWGANPYLAPLFHLKQYTFSFNKVINKKLEHEFIEHGNITPYMMAATYIPIMAGTAMLRDMLTHGGQLPAQNGFMHYMGSGFARSGLAGPNDLAELATGGVLTGNINSLRQVLGPTADQTMDAFGAIANAQNTHAFAKFVKESLPLGSIWQHY